MSGITYFCTDRHGNVYSRYSARHGEPRYTWAAIGRLIGTTARVGKACVAYSSNRETVARVAARSVRNGHYDYTTRKQEPVEAEVVEVRAYRGRWTVGREPGGEFLFGTRVGEAPTQVVQVEMIGESKITSQQIADRLNLIVRQKLFGGAR
jgi:hypothetical protein